MPSATPEAMAKFVPVPVTVAPSGNWLPGSVAVGLGAATALTAAVAAAGRRLLLDDPAG